MPPDGDAGQFSVPSLKGRVDDNGGLVVPSDGCVGWFSIPLLKGRGSATLVDEERFVVLSKGGTGWFTILSLGSETGPPGAVGFAELSSSRLSDVLDVPISPLPEPPGVLAKFIWKARSVSSWMISVD